AEQIVKEQKKMLISLLEYPFCKVVLDRTYIQRQESTNLVTNPAEVLEEVRSHFQNQFINRREDSAEIKKLWFEEY
ncbi:685_t:CDS:1, partial [Dentiscutata heterogama]